MDGWLCGVGRILPLPGQPSASCTNELSVAEFTILGNRYQEIDY